MSLFPLQFVRDENTHKNIGSANSFWGIFMPLLLQQLFFGNCRRSVRARGTEAPSQIKGLCGDYAFGVVAQAPPLAGRIDAKIAASVS
ncbi:MAG: hypothetical protein BA873_08480 [Desulfobulbaceae bacterium C00003063]|nr:MAG: hypothetical protein BA873_08480 [Desulfobulbaceae bacterium C00003063]